MREFFVYVLYRAGVAIVSLLPLPLLFRTGELLGTVAWAILPHYRRLALRNMSIAFAGEKPRRQLRRMVRRHFGRLGANLLSGIKIAVLPIDQVSHYVTVENVEAIDRHLRQKRGVVLILSHLGSWELISQSLPKFIGHARNGTVYQPLRNRRIDRHVRKLRGRANVEMFDRNAGFQLPIELLRDAGALGVLTDQHAGDQGLWVPFFGKLASTTPLPELLAKRTGAAVVNVGVLTEATARWRVVVDEPAVDPVKASIEMLTAESNRTIAAQIARAPEDWFWVHDRWKTPNPNFLLARYKRGVYLPRDMSASNLKPFRILVRSSNWLGDAVMSVPAVRAIKRGRPDAHVTVLTPAKLAPVWRLLAEVDEVIELRRKSLLHAVRAIEKKSRFDVAVLFPNSLRAALEVWLADVPRRVGYRGHLRKWLLNQIVRAHVRSGPPEHHSKQFLRIAHDIGGNTEPAGEAVTFPRGDRAPGSNATGQTNGETLRLALCPGAEYGPAKRWLSERFAEVATAIAAETKAQWVLLGTDKDRSVGEPIAAVLGEACVNRIGQTSLAQLIEELRSCRLLLSNDTGTMHLAALLGVPTVAIFGSTEPALTGPIGTHHTVIRHHVECSPCFLRNCPIDFRCMQAVPVEEVRQAVMAMLRERVVT